MNCGAMQVLSEMGCDVKIESRPSPANSTGSVTYEVSVSFTRKNGEGIASHLISPSISAGEVEQYLNLAVVRMSGFLTKATEAKGSVKACATTKGKGK